MARVASRHVLGVESSCDDTGVSILNSQDESVLANCTDSQLRKHNLLGGIIPMIAKEYHVNNIDNIARQALETSGLKSIARDIDAIAVSTRPGLNYSLKVGLNYARILAQKYSKPLIPVHHMQAHALMPLLEHKQIRFPFMALLISGGHCLLAIVKRYNEFHLLGESRDEAPGDTLDKLARRFNLRNLGPPYNTLSGGAAIERLSQMDGADRFKYFNRDSGIPMLQKNTCEFSFSGYRSSWERLAPLVETLWRYDRPKLVTELGHMCASMQRIFLIQFCKKIHRGLMYYRMRWRYENTDAFASVDQKDHLGFKLLQLGGELDNSGPIDLVISGGVACNHYLVNGIRKVCNESIESEMRVYAPSRNLCSDNGLMIAWNGLLRYRDYLERGQSIKSTAMDIQDCVITDHNEMNLLEVSPICPIGLDISDKVAQADFKLGRLANKEISLVSSQY